MKNYKKNISEIINNISLGQNLYEGLAKAFKELIKEKREEEFYAFGIFTSGAYNYIQVTANSIAGLQEKAKEYKKNKHYENVPISDLEIELKWSPCDWIYHCKLTIDEFILVEEKLKRLNNISNQIINESDDFDSALEIIDAEITQKLNELFIATLRRVKKENSQIANNIIFGIWIGDQSEEDRAFFITKINNEKQAKKYVLESNLGYETYHLRKEKRKANKA